jgi:tape measure domain-containing protein
MSGSSDAGRLLVRIEATTAQLRQQLQDAERQVQGTAGKIDASLKRADDAFARMNKASEAAQQAIGGLSNRLGPLGAALSSIGPGGAAAAAGIAAMGVGLTAIARAGDTATATLARLSSATGGLSQAQAAYEGLFRLSQQTGIAVAESAGAFSRFAVAAKEIGGTNAQVLQLVAGIQKAGIVAGASMQETGAATQQLAQALASGTLQGDELRSLLENMPQLAQALARELGVGIGQLRKMGEEGKLTADTVFPALLSASEKMNAEFEKMPPTMGRAFGILGEGMVNFAAKLDEALGLSQAIAAAAMQAAAAVRGVTAAAFPSERDGLVASRSAAQSRAEQLRTQLAGAGDIRQLGIGQLASPDDRRLNVDAIRQQLAAAEAEVIRHNDRLAEIEKESAQERFGEAVTAQRRAEESRAQAARVAYDKVRLETDKEAKLRKEHTDRMAVIDKAAATGAISEMEATRDRARLNEDLAEGLEKLAKANDKVAGSHKAVGVAAKDADEHVQAFYKEQDKLAKEAAKAIEEEAKKREQYYQKSFDAVANIGERAFDRVGDALVQAFVSGEGAAVNFGGVLRGVMASALADVAKLAVVNPILNSVFTSSSGARPTLGAAFGGGGAGGGGVGDLLGLAGLLPKDGILSSLGISGSGSLLSTPLWATGGGFSGAASGGLVLPGSATLGGLLGGAGAGFGAGMLLNGVLGGNQLGGTIGSGTGALAGAAIGSIIPGIGTLLGGLIGGAAGGGLGGLIGPGESVKGYGYALRGNEQGLLTMTDPYYNASGSAQFDEAAKSIAALNDYLGRTGVRIGGSIGVGGNKNGPDYSNAAAGSYTEGVSKLFYGANDNELDFALASRGRQFGDAGQMQQFVDGFYAARAAMEALTAEPVPAFTQQMTALTSQFDAAIAQLRTYGLAEDSLTAARTKAIAELEAQRTETLRQSDAALEIRRLAAGGDNRGAELARQAEAARQEVDSFGKSLDAIAVSAEDKAARLVQLEEVQAAERAAIIARYGTTAATALTTALDSSINSANSLLRNLTYGSNSALAPEQRYFAAISDLSAARQALDSGGSLDAYASVASAVLPVARDFLGTSSRYGSLAAEVGQVLASRGGDGNLAAILSANVDATGGLQATFAAYGDQQLQVAGSTLAEMRRLASLIEAFIIRQKAA